MKRLALLVGLMGLMSGAAWAQNAGTNAPATNAPVKIAASEAKSHIDANASVTGKVAEVNVAEPEIVRTSTNQLKIVETPTEKPADGKQ